jgi:biopolymer transport protein ExbD
MMNQGDEIDLPHATGVSIETQDDQLIISIDKELNYYINENMFSANELGPKLAAIAEANPGKAVFVRADGDVAYKHVAGLLGKVKMAGMPKVGLVFEQGNEEGTEDEEGD